MNEEEPTPPKPWNDSESTKTTPHDYYFDGSKYWLRDDEGKWVAVAKPILESKLINSGFQPFKDHKSPSFLTPLEQKVMDISINNRVFYAGPLAGWPQGLHRFEGEQALVTREPNRIKPVKGEFPVIDELMRRLLVHEEDGIDQRIHFFSWWKHSLEAFYNGIPARGLALVLAGERESGKSLLSELLVPSLGEKKAYPYRYMIGQDNFNSELFEAVCQIIDDENADTSLPSRLRFGASTKQMVAVPGSRCRGMHQQAVTLKPLWRLMIFLNMEPDRLMVLPPLDDDVEDKMLILKVYKHPEGMPMPTGTEAQKQAFFARLMAELPHFIHYLLNDFTIPEEITGRFGVRYWHHWEVVKELHDVSPEAELFDFIERWMMHRHEIVWEGSPSDLARKLKEDENGLNMFERKAVPKPAWLGRRLAKLAKSYPDYYKAHSTRRSTIWTIRRMAGLTSGEEGKTTRVDK